MAESRRRLLVRVVDVAIPVVVALFLVSLVESTVDLSPGVKAVGMAVGAVQGAALWWRNSRPVTVMAIALVGGAVIQLLSPDAIFPYAALIAMASLAAARPPLVSVPALGALLGVTALDYLTANAGDATFAMLVAVVPWALGEAVRNRRAAIVEASHRAVSEEQGRIARELHDVLAHSVSVIVVQAAAADDVFNEHPNQARTALRSIETVGRSALAELRRVLVTVRPGEADHEDAGSWAAVACTDPGLDQLAELAEPLLAAGLEVVFHREEAPDRLLPAAVDHAAYRIVQEALTNTLRHSGASRADVTVHTDEGEVAVDVRDDGHRGTASAGQPAGRGIAGMRERATMVGGTLEAGPQPAGGFRVSARLPIRTAL